VTTWRGSTRTRAATFLLAVVFVGGGCSTGSQTPSGSSPSAQASGQATPSQAATAPVVGSVSFWDPEIRVPWITATDNVFADFHKAYPDASVDRSKIDWDTMLPKLTAAVASGSPPDLFFFDSPVTEFGAASSDLLTPITDVIDSIGRKNWSKTMLDQASVNGEVYGFPLYAYPYVIWYRKDLLDKAGLQPPTTMAELLADAQLLNKPADKLYGIAMYNDVTSVDIAGQVIASFGGRLFDDNGHRLPGDGSGLRLPAGALEGVESRRNCQD
jgi:ABC-type glycerol-3-phosphate transport system substrate-binding protein